ncbi:MAG: RNA polymerase factor sigma-54 [Ferruginibacter sp.]|nr:RNA polymerase factor sigma-54 [Ferruginibacter sp.]
MALTQRTQQKLLPKLSPQQIQSMKLLQVPTAVLEERIKEQIEENPALEQVSEDGEDEFDQQGEQQEGASEDEIERDGSEEDYDNIDISEYVQDGDDEIPDYRTRGEAYNSDEEVKTIPHKVETSFNELMLQQLGMLILTDKERTIARHIIGSIDDDGILRREISAMIDDLAFRQNIDATEREIESVLEKIQQFDPPGVAARSLQESLLIQLHRREKEDRINSLAIRMLEKYFDEFTKKHYEKIQRGLNITDDDLRSIISLIVKLNPKPANTIGEDGIGENYVVPDFFIFNNNGTLELSLNSKNAPELRISQDYREMLKDFEKRSKKDKRQKEAVLFIKQKIDSAKWFIDAIKQRQHTLLNTMEAIMNYQREFFLSGDETMLRPMILKDIAEVTNLDISTVSRVANSKFVQTEFGSYRLKFFFSESLHTDTGEEVSTREVKKILTDLIKEENKKRPYSDEKLTSLLKEKGYSIARRTVAKYREQLDIPVARLRKIL